MLNHTYTSVKNANLVDCGKKQHIPSQPTPLLKENFLGEFRTELDKKKVLAALGIATELSLEWGNIKGDIGDSPKLMEELDARTTYTSQIENFKGKVITLIEGIKYLETVVGGEQDVENEQNTRLENLEKASEALAKDLDKVNTTLTESVKVDLEELKKNLDSVTKSVENITELIQVSSKPDNALQLISGEETPGLYVPDLSGALDQTSKDVEELDNRITDVENSLDDFVTKDALGGGSEFSFVESSEFDQYKSDTKSTIDQITADLKNTVKTDKDGSVDTLSVNKLTKKNEGNIKITDSFEVESGIPLDIRFVRETIDDLLALPVEICHEGMGVIVNSLSSLYILRKPEAGTIFNQDYVSNINNWKCPEDLVTVALSKEDYDNLTEINPNVFYYIYEEEFTLTRPPRREEYESDQDFEDAQLKWKDQVIQLNQQYVSASWGIEIEELVASKASNTAIKSLETEIQRLSTLINSLSGGSSSVNLKDLNEQVSTNTVNIETLIKEEDGTIPTIQKDLSNLQSTVTSEYVTKKEITSENPEVEYIFVKKTAFDAYKQEHAQQISKEVVTDKVITLEVELSDNKLTSEENSLLFNDEKVALNKQVPVIEIIDNASYEALPEKDSKTYYYVYDNEERYVLDSEFSEYKASQSRTNSTLLESINKNKTEIGDLSSLSTGNQKTLVYAINELFTKITNMLTELEDLKNKVSNLENIE